MIGTDQLAVSLSIPLLPCVREVQLTVPSIEALDMTLQFLYTGEVALSAETALPEVFFGLMKNAEYLQSEPFLDHGMLGSHQEAGLALISHRR